jgi:hypothetical protein
LQINYLPFLAGCGFGWRCQQNSDYQPVGLRFASLPALSSLEPKTKPNFFTSPYYTVFGISFKPVIRISSYISFIQ